MTTHPVFQKVHEIQFPRARGTYILILGLEQTRILQVGNLGRFRFPVGYFAYVGSAFGPGGLGGRLKHHLNPSAPTHWHIDTLRKVARLDQVWVARGEEVQEHAWAVLLHESMKGEVPVKGFGSSDCRCMAHLFRFQECPSWHHFRGLLRQCSPTTSSALKSEPDVDKDGESLAQLFLERKM
jgi:Uri superfamily endonuclease